MVRKKILPPSSGSNNKLYASCFFFLLSLFFGLEYGCNMYLQNVCWLSIDYAYLYPRRWDASIDVSSPCYRKLGSKSKQKYYHNNYNCDCLSWRIRPFLSFKIKLKICHTYSIGLLLKSIINWFINSLIADFELS